MGKSFCTSASKVRGEAKTSFFLILSTQRLVVFLFALIFTLLTQTLMLQKCKTVLGIKMLSGHIN